MNNGFMTDKFVWFSGVVEDRADPLYLNRVRVRAFGYHTPDKVLLKTEDLPWATVMLPSTESGTSGVGRSPHGLVEGSWVIGFFRDGTDAQDPVVLGSIAALNTQEANPDVGFSDPLGNYPKKTDDITTNYLNESDVNKAARGLATQANINQETIRTGKVANSDANTTLGYVEAKSKVEAFKLTQSADTDPVNIFNFDEPASPAKPQYPFNKVYESESGHVIEIDDTADYQRIKEHHRSGTFYEIHPDGSRVLKVVKDNYEVTLGDEYVNVKGTSRVTIEGDCNLFVVGNCNTEIQGNKEEHIYGDCTQVIHGSEFKTVKKNVIEKIEGYMTLDITEYLAQGIGTYMTLTTGDYFTQTIEKDMTLKVSGALTETISGAQSTTASGNTSINNNVAISGSETVSGTIDAGGIITSSSDVITGAISLKNHLHTSSQSGIPTSKPIG
jgi:hypothetical protein